MLRRRSGCAVMRRDIDVGTASGRIFSNVDKSIQPRIVSAQLQNMLRN
jgi:hypothetical protein